MPYIWFLFKPGVVSTIMDWYLNWRYLDNPAWQSVYLNAISGSSIVADLGSSYPMLQDCYRNPRGELFIGSQCFTVMPASGLATSTLTVRQRTDQGGKFIDTDVELVSDDVSRWRDAYRDNPIHNANPADASRGMGFQLVTDGQVLKEWELPGQLFDDAIRERKTSKENDSDDDANGV
jgi:hypothetical protein